MKKHLAVLAATAVLGVTSAFAANPFSDVTPQDWAYQAVAQLASQGIVNGYPDGTFKGQNNITRYEMAQMVAKALVRQDRVDAEQNAIINRLANEFSAELNNLGVRVATLENKVGNFKFTGDARLRYTGTEDARKSKFDYRGRVKFEATVNDNTKAVVRLMGSKEFGKAGNPSTAIDRVYVQHNFGKYATVAAGRQDLIVGSGLAFDGAFEGVVATAGKDKLNGSVAFGYLQSGTYGAADKEVSDLTREKNHSFTVYQLNYNPTAKVAVKGFYAAAHESAEGVLNDNAYGASLDLKLGNKVWAGGEYVKTETQGANGEAWTAGLSYGNYNMAKQGTWSVKGQYYDIKKDAPVVDSALTFVKKDQKGVVTTAKYALAKNVGLAATATIDTKGQDNKAKAESYRAELNYKF